MLLNRQIEPQLVPIAPVMKRDILIILCEILFSTGLGFLRSALYAKSAKAPYMAVKNFNTGGKAAIQYFRYVLAQLGSLGWRNAQEVCFVPGCAGALIGDRRWTATPPGSV